MAVKTFVYAVVDFDDKLLLSDVYDTPAEARRAIKRNTEEFNYKQAYVKELEVVEDV